MQRTPMHFQLLHPDSFFFPFSPVSLGTLKVFAVPTGKELQNRVGRTEHRMEDQKQDDPQLRHRSKGLPYLENQYEEYGDDNEFLSLPHKDPWASLWIFILLFLALISRVIVNFYHWLPEPKPLDAPANVFSGSRAKKLLEELTSFSPRTVGSVNNEINSPLLLLRELNRLQELISKHSLDVLLEVDVQHPSGAFHTTFLGGFTNTYNTVTNVVARVSPKSLAATAQQHALLINAHFDSAPGSPAAADDCANIAVLLELLQTLIFDGLPQRALVFLFNGAEETNWQAAHGFVTTHPWAASLRAVINLEASGTGGRELVIQLGPGNPWIVDLYVAHVPYPRLTSAAQAIFQSGQIPGETDFQVFRDYGGLIGVDMAHIEDGYTYHTSLDTTDRVPAAALQRTGENLKVLVHVLCRSPRFPKQHLPRRDPKDGSLLAEDAAAYSAARSGGARVDQQDQDEGDEPFFFDVLGIHGVSHGWRMAAFFSLLAYGGLALVLRQYLSTTSPTRTKLGLGSAVRMLLLSLLYGLGFSVLTALMMILTGRAMLWFRSEWMALALFGSASLFGFTLARWAFGARAVQLGCSSSEVQQLVSLANDVFYASVLTLFWLCYPPLVYFPCFLLLFSLLPRLIFCQHSAWLSAPLIERLGPRVLLGCLSHLLPLLVIGENFLTVMDFLVPLSGRSFTVPLELAIAVVVSFLGWAWTLNSFSLLHLSSRRGWQQLTAFAGCSWFCVVLLLVLLYRRPYTAEQPKRLWIQHIERQFFNQTHAPWAALASSHVIDSDSDATMVRDTGLWLNAWDWRGMNDFLGLDIPAFAAGRPGVPSRWDRRASGSCLAADEGGVHCDFPLYLPIMYVLGTGWYLPTQTLPSFPVRTTAQDGPKKLGVTLLREEKLGKTRRLHFRAVGSYQMTVAFNRLPVRVHPVPDASTASASQDNFITRWSFYPSLPSSPTINCDCYWVFHAEGRPVRKRTQEQTWLEAYEQFNRSAQLVSETLRPKPFSASHTQPVRPKRGLHAVIAEKQPLRHDGPAIARDQLEPLRHAGPAMARTAAAAKTKELEPKSTQGTELKTWEFWVEVRAEDTGVGGEEEERLALAFYTHYLDSTSEEMENVRQQLPKWVAPVSWNPPEGFLVTKRGPWFQLRLDPPGSTGLSLILSSVLIRLCLLISSRSKYPLVLA
eukprot:g28365.t1